MKTALSSFNIKLLAILTIAIIFPSLFLAYFSLRTINNEKDLMEKRIREDEADLAEKVSEEFEQSLQTASESVFSLSKSNGFNFFGIKALRDSSRNEAIRMVFALDITGEFIFPNFPSSVSVAKGKLFFDKPELASLFAKAQKNEFASQNYPQAVSLYQQLLRKRLQKQERAEGLNCLARTYTKMGRYGKAIEIYEQMLHSYPTSFDQEGVPLALYAAFQLVEISHSQGRPLESLKYLGALLNGLADGRIPMFEGLDFFLAESERKFNGLWKETIGNEGMVVRDQFLRDLTAATRDFQFVSNYSKELRGALESRQNFREFGSAEFQYVSGQVGEDPYLIGLREISDSQGRPFGTLGLQFDLEKVKQKISSTVLKEEAKAMGLDFAIVDENQIAPFERSHEREPVHVASLSGLEPVWRVAVYQKDPQSLVKYVRLRTGVYLALVIVMLSAIGIGIYLISRDVTREIKLAQLRSDFVSNVSHELKTPLTSIRMFAETLRLGRVRKPTQKRDYLDTIVNESERLSRLINNVLDFSKIEKGRKVYNFAPADLNKLIDSTLNTFSYQLTKEGFILRKDIVRISQPVEIDADAIEQALLNLLSNAVKYSPERREIILRVWENSDWLMIEVQDFGVGIPQDERDKIFDKFYRISNPNVKQTGGAGLGLTLVKHIAEAHGGEIRVRSVEGEGSTFSLRLPKRRSQS